MGKKYRRYKNSVEKYLSSEKGARFFHVIYSVGASIVIVGALCKINHIPGGSLILLIGMVTEAIIFFLSAFDRPSKEYKWEEVYPVLGNSDNNGDENIDASAGKPAIRSTTIPAAQGGGTVIINGGESSTAAVSSGTASANIQNAAIQGGAFIGGSTGAIIPEGATVTEATEKYVDQLSKISGNMEKFAEVTSSLANMSEALMASFKTVADNSDRGYLNQLDALNRNIAGLNTIYEVQLKGVSGQIHTIESINAGLDRMKRLYDGSLVDSSIFKNETEKMAQQLTELNRVYARLLQAMTVNMNMNLGGFNTPNTQQDNEK